MKSISSMTVVLSLLTLVGVAKAQDYLVLHENLQKFKIAKERSQNREGHLLHLAFRHSLGLPIDGAQYFTLDQEEQNLSVQDINLKLQETQDQIKGLAVTHLQLKVGVKERQAQILAQQPEGAEGAIDYGTDVHTEILPAIPPAPAIESADVRIHQPFEINEGHDPAVTEPSTEAGHQESGELEEFNPVIRGSKDRGVVGKILYKAGKYAAAVRELTSLQSDPNVKIVDLFYLAKSYEGLHETAPSAELALEYYTKAYDLYLRIQALDIVVDESGKKVAGMWGRNVQSSLKVMQKIKDYKERESAINSTDAGGRGR